MSLKSLFRNLIATIVFVGVLTACENNQEVQMNMEDSPRVQYITPEDNSDTTVLIVNSFNDLQSTLSSVALERENKLFQEGWVKVEEKEEEHQTRGLSRAKRQVITDTVYISRETIDYVSDPSVYADFNAKFSKAMVDSINRVVSSEYRLSTSKTYVCCWRLFGTYYNAQNEEQVASRPSPLCALVPSTKSSYTARGYSLYKHTSGNLTQYQLDSYQLHIKWEKTSNKTIVLDIDWPFFPRNPSGYGDIGYQFIYAISKTL